MLGANMGLTGTERPPNEVALRDPTLDTLPLRIGPPRPPPPTMSDPSVLDVFRERSFLGRGVLEAVQGGLEEGSLALKGL
jgi:hypothetical protein